MSTLKARKNNRTSGFEDNKYVVSHVGGTIDSA